MDRNFNEPVALQITFLQVAKGGLISESFSLWLNLQIKDPNHSPEHFVPKNKCSR